MGSEMCIRDSIRGHNNDMYIGTVSAGFFVVRNDEVVAHYNESKGIISNSVLDFEMDESGGVWVATDKGLNYIDEIIVDDASAIASSNQSWFRLFPNPVSDQLYLSINLEQNDVLAIRFIDASGRVVAHMDRKNLPHRADMITWNLNDYNGRRVLPGIYIVPVSYTHLTLPTKRIV